MQTATVRAILAKTRAKRGAAEDFASAVRQMASRQLKADALRDVRNLALAGVGAGAGLRGLAGLVNLYRQNAGPAPKSGPAVLPLPYPVEDEEEQRPRPKLAGALDFLGGDQATTTAGIPWYMPAMTAAAVGGAYGGSKGLGLVLDRLRRRERSQELDRARQEFHDALLSQYDKPPAAPGVKAAAVAAGLDELYRRFVGAFSKLAVSWNPLDPDTQGAALGAYATAGGLGALLSGAVVYDKLKKRSQRAVLEKAMQRRARRQFMQQPTEIYAVPEPVPQGGGEQ